MATRLYFNSTEVPNISPSFGGWDRTTEARRGVMRPGKLAVDSGATDSIWTGTSGPAAATRALAAQLISPEMEAGVVFSTSDTLTGVILVKEKNNSNNIDRVPCLIRIWDRTGTVQRAALKSLGYYGPGANEWNTTGCNRIFLNSVNPAVGYTTVAGDYLVLEIGAQISSGAAGTNVLGNVYCFSNSGAGDAALADDDNPFSTPDPWIEFSNNIRFVSHCCPCICSRELIQSEILE